MYKQSRWQVTACLLLTVAAWLARPVGAIAEPAPIKHSYLFLSPYTEAQSICSKRELQTLAGCTMELNIRLGFEPQQVNPEIVAHGFPVGLPSGLTLRASFDSSGGFSEFLMQKLKPRLIDFSQRETDSLWKALPDSFQEPPMAWLNQFHFFIIPPGDWIGRRVYFQATYVSPYFGTLVNEDPGHDPIEIVAPCGTEDSISVMASHVIFDALDPENRANAVAVEDSMLTKGWKHSRALERAQGVARTMGLYEKSLQFLDTLYTMNDEYAQQHVWGYDAVSKQHEYDRIRTQLLELKSKQQHEQR